MMRVRSFTVLLRCAVLPFLASSATAFLTSSATAQTVGQPALALVQGTNALVRFNTATPGTVGTRWR